jgi:CheY-like chemotaxis protein
MGEPGPVTPWRGSGLILVIDDNALVCEVLRHLLEGQGFTVLTATDGPAGVALFPQHSVRELRAIGIRPNLIVARGPVPLNPEIKAVLLDLIMPGMSGQEVFRAIQAIRPEARVLLLTGMSEAEVKAHLGHTATGYIQKSFQLAPFLAKLRQVLGE